MITEETWAETGIQRSAAARSTAQTGSGVRADVMGYSLRVEILTE
jgi:hypothetical protein